MEVPSKKHRRASVDNNDNVVEVEDDNPEELVEDGYVEEDDEEEGDMAEGGGEEGEESEEDDEDEEDEEEVLQVTKVSEARWRNYRTVEYRCHWKGYDADDITWQTRMDIEPKSVLETFISEQTKLGKWPLPKQVLLKRGCKAGTAVAKKQQKFGSRLSKRKQPEASEKPEGEEQEVDMEEEEAEQDDSEKEEESGKKKPRVEEVKCVYGGDCEDCPPTVCDICKVAVVHHCCMIMSSIPRVVAYVEKYSCSKACKVCVMKAMKFGEFCNS
jgi:hypothetical protein